MWQNAPISAFALQVNDQPSTKAYRADGYLTGIKSAVIVPQSPSKVFDSLAADLHLLFGAIEVELQSTEAQRDILREGLKRLKEAQNGQEKIKLSQYVNIYLEPLLVFTSGF